MRSVPSLLAVVLLLAASGCASILGGTEWRRELGHLDVENALHGSLEAPDRVSRGEPFQVTVTTYNSSSCTRSAGAEAQVKGALAVIRPYDRVAHGDVICTSDQHAFPRSVTLRFGTSGHATIRVVGARGAQVERTVLVE